jgi:hypothetical protein
LHFDEIPNGITFENIDVTDFSGSLEIDVLIGMDIITAGDLAITNENGNTVVSFRTPHGAQAIDFEAISH